MFVTVTSVAAMLVMVSAPTDDMDLARKAYSNCVVDNVIVQLDNGIDENSSKTALTSVCKTEQKAFVDAFVRYERSEGTSTTDAKEFAAEEVEMILEESTQSYARHLADGTRPEKEA